MNWHDRDRKIQKIILEILNKNCPYPAEVTSRYGFIDSIRYEGKRVGLSESQMNEKHINRNIYYLKGHGLVSYPDNLKTSYIYDLRITSQGIDFLADDGGLSAILGVVTVKLHSDTIQALLAAKIDQADIPEEEKSRLKTELAKIKDAALSTLTEKAIDAFPAASLVTLLKTTFGL